MYIFKCEGFSGETASIQIASLYWTDSGSVTFTASEDKFACTLLTHCQSDSGGFFNLLAGCKPLFVEQWLEYLQEKKLVKKVTLTQQDFEPELYSQQLQLNDENASELLDLLYRIGGFNRLQISRYLKYRNNITYLSTKYDRTDLQRYQLLGKAINFILKLKR